MNGPINKPDGIAKAVGKTARATQRRGAGTLLLAGLASIGDGFASMGGAFSGRRSPSVRRVMRDLQLSDAERLDQDRRRLARDRTRW